MFFFKKKYSTPLAIDVGDSSIEALMLTGGLSAGFSHRVELSAGIIKDGEIVDQEKFIAALKSLADEFKKQDGGFKKEAPAALNLPESKTFIYCFNIGAVANNELTKAVSVEAEKIIPWRTQDVFFDFILKKTTDMNRVIYVAAPKKLVDDYVAAFKSAGLNLTVVGAESLSLGCALLPTNVNHGATLILDVGARVANISIFDKNNLLALSSSAPIAGEVFSADIARDKNISLPEAEELKKKTADILDPQNKTVYPSLWKSINDLAQEARKAIVYFEKKQGQIIEAVILCGGSSLIKGMETALAARLDKKVIAGDSIVKIKNSDKLDNAGPSIFFADVIGLALSVSNNKSVQINLLRDKK